MPYIIHIATLLPSLNPDWDSPPFLGCSLEAIPVHLTRRCLPCASTCEDPVLASGAPILPVLNMTGDVASRPREQTMASAFCRAPDGRVNALPRRRWSRTLWAMRYAGGSSKRRSAALVIRPTVGFLLSPAPSLSLLVPAFCPLLSHPRGATLGVHHHLLDRDGTICGRDPLSRPHSRGQT